MIKFRGKRIDNGEWVYGDFMTTHPNPTIIISNDPTEMENFTHVVSETVGMYIGIIDGHGNEIYVGDIIRHRYPIRDTQVHEGDNIPNGIYIEPMEAIIVTEDLTVKFEGGELGGEGPDQFLIPINHLEYQWDEEAVKNAISYGGRDIFDWNETSDGDLQCLLDDNGLDNLEELLTYITGIEVVGNIHD